MSPHLVLFFTRGVSLRTWSMVGMLDREIAVYKYLNSQGFQISFLTYGDAKELGFAQQLGDIRILCNHHGLPLRRYEDLLFSIHGHILRSADVFKTNQTYGSEIALWASLLFRKQLVARCGYMWSNNAAREHGPNSPEALEARRVERKVFSAADGIVVTTKAMLSDVENRIESAGDKTRVIPNYVDTHIFRPNGQERDPNTLIFVGRIAPEKNLESFLEAVVPLNVKVVMVGEGRLRPQLQERFSILGDRVIWEGNVPNSQLPAYINRAAIFVLPSLYEGHPKSIIEAMACGIPVIGSDSPGIRDLISHMETGCLCGTDPESIRSAIENLLNRPNLCREMGEKARRYILENYSLPAISRLELAFLEELLNQK